MIIEAVQGNYPFYAWQSIGGVVEKCRLKLKAFRKDHNEMELVLEDDSVKSLKNVVSGNRNVNVYIPELSMSFSTDLKSISADNKMKLFIPTDFQFYERRKHERVHTKKTMHATFEYNKKTDKKSVYDLSFGGFSLILTKSDGINIKKGKVLDVLTLEIDSKKIKLKAECVQTCEMDRYRAENLPYGGIKLAFRFTSISKEDRAFFTELISHEVLLGQVTKKPKTA